MFRDGDREGIVQQDGEARRELAQWFFYPTRTHATIGIHFCAGKVVAGCSQKRYSTEKLSSGQPVQNKSSAAARDDELPSLTSGKKEHSLCRVVTLNDHGRPGEMPVGRRGDD